MGNQQPSFFKTEKFLNNIVINMDNKKCKKCEIIQTIDKFRKYSEKDV
jgi:hypothetical protein